MIYYALFLVLVAFERIAEVRRSDRNVAWALERGGLELGRRHFRVMTLVHAIFLPACLFEVWGFGRPWIPALGVPMLGVALLAQGLRWWAVASLGRRWNVRVVVVPGAPVVTGGPYRFIRHPNYVAVALEIAAIPLVHTAWLTALVFTVLNAPLLATRIRCEEHALRTYNDYTRLARLPRLVPKPGTRP